MIRTLYLLRHAKSSWAVADLPDHDRPLAPRGRRACELVAGYLRGGQVAPALVLCSSSLRTRQTLEGIASTLPADVKVAVEDGLYGATASGLAARLRAGADTIDSVLLIGHQPAIQELALSLARSGARIDALRVKYPTGALAELAFDGRWSDLAPGSGELVAYVRPRELESSG